LIIVQTQKKAEYKNAAYCSADHIDGIVSFWLMGFNIINFVLIVLVIYFLRALQIHWFQNNKNDKYKLFVYDLTIKMIFLCQLTVNNNIKWTYNN